MKYKNHCCGEFFTGGEWLPRRLVFEDASPGLGTAAGSPPEAREGSEEKDGGPDDARKDIQRQKIAVDTSKNARDLAQEAPDIGGSAEKYLSLFKDKKNPEYQNLLGKLITGIANNDQGIFFNVDRWANIDPPSQVALLFKMRVMPLGPGYKAFVEGLEKGDANVEDPEYKKCLGILRSIIAELRADLDAHARGQEDFASHRDTPLLGYGMKELGDTFMRNWHESTGWKKAAIVVGGGAIFHWLWSHKDKKILPGLEVSYWDGAKLFGAACAVNLIWKQFNPKGQSLLGSMDVSPSVDDLKEEKNKELALYLGMGENEKKLATWEKITYMDVRDLYRAYEPVSRAGAAGKRQILPEQVGLPKDSIDPVSLYEIIDTLVMETAFNSGLSKERLKNNHGDALTAFENKYMRGDLARTHPTLFSAYFYEFRTKDYGNILARYESQKTQRQIVDTVSQGVTDTGKLIVRGYENVTDWQGWQTFKNSVLHPIGRYAEHYYSRVAPYVSEIFDDVVTAYEVTDVDDVIPADWGLSGDSQQTIRLLGVAGIGYTVFAETDGDKKITIDGVDFSKKGGISASNEDERDELFAKLQTRVKDAIKAKAGTAVAALTATAPEWDGIKKEWIVPSVTVAGNPLLSAAAGSSDVSVRLNKNGEAEFFVNGKEVADSTKLAETHDSANVENAIAAERGYEMLHGLPVAIEAAQDLGGGRTRILGKIAGLEFDAVGDTGTLANLQFQDATGIGAVGKLDHLFVGENNGGLEFLDRKAARILTSPAFLKPFFELQDLIGSTGEGIWARTAEMFKDRALWIIPTNFSGAINGKVLQEQWKYMLDFKKSEALGSFQYLALNNTGDNLKAAYDNTVGSAITDAQTLANDIRMLANDEQRATMFADHMTRLEHLNYSNPEMQKLFDEYKQMVREYDFAGLESLTDIHFASKEAHEIYQVLMYVWSNATVDYANLAPGSLSAAMQAQVREGVVDKVRAVLDAAKQNGGGTIKQENLPPFDTPQQRLHWLDPAFVTSSRSPWAVGP